VRGRRKAGSNIGGWQVKKINQKESREKNGEMRVEMENKNYKLLREISPREK